MFIAEKSKVQNPLQGYFFYWLLSNGSEKINKTTTSRIILIIIKLKKHNFEKDCNINYFFLTFKQ